MLSEPIFALVVEHDDKQVAYLFYKESVAVLKKQTH